jgi:hypothetical protein
MRTDPYGRDNHPADNPFFNKASTDAVWYMAHPVAPDEKYDFAQNMAHVLHMMRLCFDEEFRVITPYHTHCLVLDDTNAAHRAMGLEIDCQIVRMLGVMILAGHKISRGMQIELDVLREGPSNYWIDLTGMSDDDARQTLRANKRRMKQLTKIAPIEPPPPKSRRRSQT